MAAAAAARAAMWRVDATDDAPGRAVRALADEARVHRAAMPLRSSRRFG
jgi:hypothetical protein